MSSMSGSGYSSSSHNNSFPADGKYLGLSDSKYLNQLADPGNTNTASMETKYSNHLAASQTSDSKYPAVSEAGGKYGGVDTKYLASQVESKYLHHVGGGQGGDKEQQQQQQQYLGQLAAASTIMCRPVH